MNELSINDAADAFGVHEDTVRRWISDGRIAAEKRRKGRRRYYIPSSDTDTIIPQTHEIDVTRLTNEIFRQREVLITLFDVMSQLHVGETVIADEVRQTNAKLDKLTAKIDDPTSKCVKLEAITLKPQHRVKYRKYWWQFWLSEKP